jgi:hypothetical protein
MYSIRQHENNGDNEAAGGVTNDIIQPENLVEELSGHQ